LGLKKVQLGVSPKLGLKKGLAGNLALGLGLKKGSAGSLALGLGLKKGSAGGLAG